MDANSSLTVRVERRGDKYTWELHRDGHFHPVKFSAPVMQFQRRLRRREFIILFGGTAVVALPMGVQAQQSRHIAALSQGSIHTHPSLYSEHFWMVCANQAGSSVRTYPSIGVSLKEAQAPSDALRLNW
jgi:hypothetical protein